MHSECLSPFVISVRSVALHIVVCKLIAVSPPFIAAGAECTRKFPTNFPASQCAPAPAAMRYQPDKLISHPSINHLFDFPSINEAQLSNLRIIRACCWVSLFVFCSLLGASAKVAADLPTHAINVRNAPYRAKGDGKTDDTRAFQAALNAAGAKGGGTVFVPVGTYLIKSHLTVPAGTSLVGVARAPQLYDPKLPGSTLLAVEGAGSIESTAFLTLEGPNTTLEGITVFYPNQIVSEAPTLYPWTVQAGAQANISLLNVLLVNPYQAVSLVGAGRHTIRGLYGQPLSKGIWVDKCYDVGRIEDVHFWPFWSLDKRVLNFQWAQATAFIFQRTDWEIVQNAFCWGYRVGIEFSASKDGAMNGQLTNIGLDAVDIGILARETQGPGVSFSNLSIANDNNGKDHIAIWGQEGQKDAANRVITGTSFLYINGGSFWGVWNRVVKWETPGVITLGSSRLTPFRLNGPMVEILAGQATLHDNTFAMYPRVTSKKGVAISLGATAESVLVHDNQLNGHTIENQAGDRATIHHNRP